MNGNPPTGLRRYGFLAVLMLSIFSAKANPISDGGTMMTYMILVPISLAILLEAICVRWMLMRCRRPRLFILWVVAMHLVTYPLFIGLLWVLSGLHPALAVTVGEGAIVLVEGAAICLMCRFLSPADSPLPAPSMAKSLFASLVGNICSAAAFPVILGVFGRIAYFMMSSGEE